MAQQTAVEWLFDQIPLEWTIKRSAFDALQQAKAMEKEQILDAYKNGEDNIDSDGCHIDNDGAEQYYNETYNK